MARPQPDLDQTLMTAAQLAAALQVNEKDLYRKALRGEIPSYKFGKCRRFRLSEVLEASRDRGPEYRPGARKSLGLGRPMPVRRVG